MHSRMVDKICAEVGISGTHFCRCATAECGQNFRQSAQLNLLCGGLSCLLFINALYTTANPLNYCDNWVGDPEPTDTGLLYFEA